MDWLRGDIPWEEALPGKVIVLTGDSDGDGVIDVQMQETNIDGEVWFENLTPGTYTLHEDLSVFDLDGDGSNANDHIMPSPDPDNGGPIPGGADKRTFTPALPKRADESVGPNRGAVVTCLASDASPPPDRIAAHSA